MAQPVKPVIIGIDTAKRHLDIYHAQQQHMQRVNNERAAIAHWLKQQPPTTIIGIEATNTFHLELVDQAHQAGMTVYIIDGYRLTGYRQGTGGRSKSDCTDAKLIARYVTKERDELRAYQPLPARQRRFWQLLRRRAKVVEAAKALRQSLAGIGDIQTAVKTTLQQLKTLIELLEKRLKQLAVELGWRADMLRVKTLYGIGDLTSLALVATYHKANFTRVDAFIAFLGLDIRVRESGTFKGKGKLTKKGDSECRRLLYNAAQSAARGEHLHAYYQRQIQRGHTPTQAIVPVMRKLARIAFALLRDQTEFREPASHHQPGETCGNT